MNVYKFLILLSIIYFPSLAQEKNDLPTYIELLATAKTNHKFIFNEWLKDWSVDSLIELTTNQSDTLTALFRYSCAQQASSPHELTSTISKQHMNEIISMRSQTQKALMGLKIIQIHEQRKNQRNKYRLGQYLCNFASICSAGGGMFMAHSQDYTKALLLGVLGAGFFAAGWYFGKKKTEIQNLPEPTKAQMYESENKPGKPNHVAEAMEKITLTKENDFFNLVQSVNRYAGKKKITFFKGLKELACDKRNIGAVLVLTDFIEQAEKESSSI